MKHRLAPVVFSLPLEKNLHRSLVWSLAIILAVVPVFAMEYWFIGVIAKSLVILWAHHYFDHRLFDVSLFASALVAPDDLDC